jgi:DNA-binding MarR family transcriptional regulator
VTSEGSSRAALVAAVQLALRRFGDEVNLYESAVAERLGMHPTDLQFLGFVQLHGPTTPGHLAELSGLTTGAVTGVIDRLERAGFVRRLSDPADRRRVLVEGLPERERDVQALFDPLLRAMVAVTDRYDDQELAVVLDFADRAGPVLEEQRAELRLGAPDPAPPRAAKISGRDLSAPLGGVREATLRFSRGASQVRISGDASPSELFHGQFATDQPTAKIDGGVVNIRYRSSARAWRAKFGEVALNPAAGWRLDFVGGATRIDTDLTSVPVRAITAHGGMSHVTFRLPAAVGLVPVRLTGGVNDVTFTRPAGTAVELRVRGGAVNLELDGERRAVVGGRLAWESSPATSDRYDIEITGGARTVVISTA